MKKYVLLLTLIMVSISLSSCSNTFNGAGRDIEGAGEWMQETF